MSYVMTSHVMVLPSRNIFLLQDVLLILRSLSFYPVINILRIIGKSGKLMVWPNFRTISNIFSKLGFALKFDLSIHMQHTHTMSYNDVLCCAEYFWQTQHTHCMNKATYRCCNATQNMVKILSSKLFPCMFLLAILLLVVVKIREYMDRGEK